jgi:flagellin-like hook-associated protein FlgL
LDVVGFNASSGNLGITAATWTTGGSIDTDVTKLDAATSTLSQNSSKLSANLSIITTRQDFSTNMENTLTAGADKLTLADTNEEGANMLMLQTRQSLATTALSLSAQAAQSVLKLFQ